MKFARTLAALTLIGTATVAYGQLTRSPERLGGAGQATIYRNPDYSGDGIALGRAQPDLKLRWQARSIRIERGTWELCSEPNFEGRCTRLDRSNANLPQSQRAVQSMRPVYAGGWDLVGQTEVGDQSERDTIISWGHVRHKRVRVCVEGHAVRFYDLELVFFFDGQQDVPVQALVGDGQCTRDINLGRGGKDLSFINMTYETFSFGPGSARVNVYAQR